MEHHFALASASPEYRANRRLVERFTAHARRARRNGVLRIPVVVHVLHGTDAHDIGMRQIHSQIAVLNADFRAKNSDIDLVPAPFRSLVADSMIEFALATRDPNGNPTVGVTRTRVRPGPFTGETPDLDAAIKYAGSGHPAWPADSYLNLWVCDLGVGLLGYAQFPGGPPATDGVVVNVTAFGTNGTARAPFDGGRTATHEVGHWLNLLHIWGDDRGGCNGSDNVADTPNQAGPNEASPSFPCVSCNNGPNGDMFMNYMDYVDDDAMFMFTRGQSRRMDATLLGARASLGRSRGLETPETPRLELPVFAPNSQPEREPGGDTDRIFDGIAWVPGSRMPEEASPATPSSSLVGRWVRVSADADSATFAREGSRSIAPRRATTVLEIGEDGLVRLLEPGPTDAPIAASILEPVPGAANVLRSNSNGRGDLRVLERIDEDSLRLRFDG